MRLSLLLVAIPALLAAQSPEQLFLDGRVEEAKAGFQAKLAANRNDANAMYWLGRIAGVQQKRGDAIEWFERAVKVEPNTALYHLWLGNALGEEAGNASKVRQPFLARRVKASFERAVQLDPTMVQARLGLVDFYSIAPGVMGGSMEKAREQAMAIVALNPMRGHLALGRLAQRRKDLPGEEKAYRDVIAAAPDSMFGYLSLGALLRRQSRWDDAFVVYEAYMTARPGDPIAGALWGITAGQSGRNMERGERELTRFLANPGNPVSPVTLSAAHFRLGQIYERTGRTELARTAYDEAVRLQPGNADAKAARKALK